MSTISVSVDSNTVSLLGKDYVSDFLARIATTRLRKEYSLQKQTQYLQSITPSFSQQEKSLFASQQEQARESVWRKYAEQF